MRKLTKLLAILLAVLMTVSVFPVSVLAVDNIITAVDTDGLVMTTKFLYSGKDEAGNVWASKAAALVNITKPDFYEKIPATVDGVETELEVDWTLVKVNGQTEIEGVPVTDENYVASAIGTIYTFQAVAPEGYTWGAEVEAPTIEVEIVDGAIGYDGIRGGIITNHTAPINVVYKDYVVYDATGCNQFFTLGSGTADANRLVFGAALSSISGGLKRTDAFTAPDYKDGTNIYATGNITGSVAGGGYGVNLKGDTNVVVENATLKGSSVGQVFGGGFSNKSGKHAKVDGSTNVTVIGSTMTTDDAIVYGGGWAYNSSIDTTVTKDTNITIKDGSTVKAVYGGSYAYKISVAPVNGTANITIIDSTVTTVYAGSRGSNADSKAAVANANIDISGNSKVTTINAGGNLATTNVTGTTIIDIHDLEGEWNIGTVTKGNAAKLVVKLDDTSKSLLTDGSITVT